ncbi:MAG: ABC transporter permease [Deinococcota bacterium]
MLRFLISRVFGAVLALLLLTLVTFIMVRLVPGSIEDVVFGLDGSSDAARQALRERYNLDQPLAVQYVTWLGNLLQGDWGDSIRGPAARTVGAGRVGVRGALMEKIQPTLELALLSMLLSLVVAILLGTLAALKRGTWIDQSSTTLALIGTSTPDFVLGLLLILGIARSSSFFPIFGYAPLSEGFVEWLRHLILPTLALSFALMGLLTRLTRRAVSDTLQHDWVRTARGKGLPRHVIWWHHIIRPSLIPVVTTAGLQFVAVLGGIVVIETVFSIPGLGRLILDAIRNRDYALIQGAVLLIGMVAITVSLLVDFSYRLLDPRVRT